MPKTPKTNPALAAYDAALGIPKAGDKSEAAMSTAKFNWRENLDAVNKLLDLWNEIAENPRGGWSLPKETLWIEGAIYGLTGKEVSVGCMDDICKALGVPYRRRDDGMVEWGDAVGTGKDVFAEEVAGAEEREG